MLTYNHIMLVRAKKLRTEWDIKLTDIMTIRKERTGMAITLKGGTNGEFMISSGPTMLTMFDSGPFVPVSEESSRNWLYKQIEIAVNAFNDKYNAKG